MHTLRSFFNDVNAPTMKMPNLDEYDDLNTNDANMNNDYDDDYDYDDEDEDDDDGYNRRPLKRGRVKKTWLINCYWCSLNTVFVNHCSSW